MMSKRNILVPCLIIASWCGVILLTGCVNLKAPENVHIANRNEPRRVDSSRAPHTRNHEEARQKLAEAYERNRYLEDRVRRLEAENRELEDEIDELKDRYDD